MSARRSLLLPLVPIYAAALAVKRHTRRLLPHQRRALNGAVVSIGSLSAGGAGKTPFVLLLAEILQRRDYAVHILTRGYGRSAKTVERVDPAGDPDRFGDEPLLLARRSGALVFVGADRYQAGLLAEKIASNTGGPDKDPPANRTVVYLLDDGFQHRALARDIDIVLLTREDIDDHLLPAGNLREPLATLHRADIIVVREDEAGDLESSVATLTTPTHSTGSALPVVETGPHPVWTVRRSLRFPASPSIATTKRPLAFCGIARPENLVAMLREGGIEPAGSLFFADHHHYTERDVRHLLETARAARADGLITTEKDAVRLSPAMRSRLEEVGPLLVPELRLELVDEHAAMEQLIGMVGRLDRRRRR